MKQLFTFVFTFGIAVALHGADMIWCAVTDRAESIELSRINCLVAADGEDIFSVLLDDGSTVDDVKSLSFERLVPTSISPVLIGNNPDILFDTDGVTRSVTVTGLAPLDRIAVMSLDGRSLICRDNDGALSVTLDVSGLSSGYYILSVGTTVTKFYKK